MTPLAFLLVTLSACAHALWNFLGKRHNPSAALFLAASLAAILLFSPTLFVLRRGLAVMPAPAWGLLLATGVTQVLYYCALAGAYRLGDLSWTYPLARALPVVLIALVSLALGRASQIGALALVGFVCVTVGCLMLPLPRFADLRWPAYRQPAVRRAILAAAGITAYMLIDDYALRLLRALPDTSLSNLEWALLWVELETISLSLFLFLLVMGKARERMSLQQILRRQWLFASALGGVITLAYGLVLWAMAYVRDVSYLAAFRQLSIPIGAALGILWRKEPAYPPKLTGLALVVIGLLLAAIS
jgi:uncharacterized membrane protein